MHLIIMQDISLLFKKLLGLLNNWLIYPMHSLLIILMLSLLDAIKKESTICRLLLWAQMGHPMVMEHIFLIYISKILTLMPRQKLILLQLEVDK